MPISQNNKGFTKITLEYQSNDKLITHTIITDSFEFNRRVNYDPLYSLDTKDMIPKRNFEVEIKIPEAYITTAIEKTTPPRWYHGHDSWVFDSDFQVYKASHPNQIDESFCLGDRYIHNGSGYWRGSTSCHWHGWEFGNKLEALNWLHKADYKELKFDLWSKTMPHTKSKNSKKKT